MQTEPPIAPPDEYNQALLANAHPAGWENPRPAQRYNLVVLGGGTAGLVTAAGAAGLGAKVALVESGLLGGDCLNVGCVPSKSLIRAARLTADMTRAGEFGLSGGPVAVDFAAVMRRLRSIRSEISENDSAARFRGLGVDVFLCRGRFTSPGSLEVEGRVLHFRKAVIATGGRPSVPPVEGLTEAGFLTNENVFNLTALPARLAVVGGGVIGCELAQAFARLGSRVTLVHSRDRLLNREDPEASRVVLAAFERDNIRVCLECRLDRVRTAGGEKVLNLSCGDTTEELRVDEILLAAGRRPVVEDLGLEAAGVEYDPRRGVTVDDRLRTSNRNIYAAGDVCLEHKFTHAADAAARIVIKNALFPGRGKVSRLLIPHCTFTDPEVAQVGLNALRAEQMGIEIETITAGLDRVDRARIDGDTGGFVRVHLARGTDRILGATLVAAHAGEMIGELTLAIDQKIGFGEFTRFIHPYPTQAEVIRHAADTWYRGRLTPRLAGILAAWLRWRR